MYQHVFGLFCILKYRTLPAVNAAVVVVVVVGASRLPPFSIHVLYRQMPETHVRTHRERARLVISCATRSQQRGAPSVIVVTAATTSLASDQPA